MQQVADVLSDCRVSGEDVGVENYFRKYFRKYDIYIYYYNITSTLFRNKPLFLSEPSPLHDSTRDPERTRVSHGGGGRGGGAYC